MTRDIVVEPLTARAFAEFGDIIAASGSPTKIINGGRCERFSNLARLDIDASGNAGVSLFRSEAVTLPLQLTMLERHPWVARPSFPCQRTHSWLLSRRTPVRRRVHLGLS